MAAPKNAEFIVFRYKRTSGQLAWLLITAGILFALLLIMERSDLLGVVQICSLAFGLALAILAYIIGPLLFYLKLSSDGLEFRYMGPKQFFEWGEITNIRLVEKDANTLHFRQIVVFDLARDSPQRSLLSGVAKSVRNYDVKVPEYFLASPEELLRLLRSWHDRFAPPEQLPPVQTPHDFVDQFKQWQQQYGRSS